SVWMGWHIWLDFLALLRVVSQSFAVHGIDPAHMYNFRGALALLLGPGYAGAINAASTLALCGAAAATCWLWRGEWRPNEGTFELRVALTMLLGMLFSPHVYPHDGLMLIVPAFLFYSYLRQRGLPRETYAALILSCPLLFLIGELVVGDKLGIRLPVAIIVVLAVWMCKALVEAAEPRGSVFGVVGRNEQGDVSVSRKIR
ncbi:MAG TPA: hypothetical protein VFX76_11090, partial [Roseiflexaceae bacterium]|nr:hypothetical protein [Roseiflexaceae bacterium]